MIELIFAIVIMGFVFMSLPMIITQVKHASNLGLKQESIALLASQMNLVMSNEWDDKNTRSLYSSYVLKTEGDSNLAYNDDTKMRGSRTAFKNTRLFSEMEDVYASEALVIEYDKDTTNIMDDVDDYNEREVALKIGGDENSKDYVDQKVKINSNIHYSTFGGNYNGLDVVISNDGVSGTRTDIKEIVGTLTTESPRFKTKLVLKAFASNLGAYSPEIRGGI